MRCAQGDTLQVRNPSVSGVDSEAEARMRQEVLWLNGRMAAKQLLFFD